VVGGLVPGRPGTLTWATALHPLPEPMPAPFCGREGASGAVAIPSTNALLICSLGVAHCARSVCHWGCCFALWVLGNKARPEEARLLRSIPATPLPGLH